MEFKGLVYYVKALKYQFSTSKIGKIQRALFFETGLEATNPGWYEKNPEAYDEAYARYCKAHTASLAKTNKDFSIVVDDYINGRESPEEDVAASEEISALCTMVELYKSYVPEQQQYKVA